MKISIHHGLRKPRRGHAGSAMFQVLFAKGFFSFSRNDILLAQCTMALGLIGATAFALCIW